ncbi:MAG TPA: hypothetical protein VFS43_07255 [Polyangiaceae bacterium]|nr:hypothetical protein [Polyangiaceae bacterium]
MTQPPPPGAPGPPAPDEALVEAVAGAYRPEGLRAVRAHPNWYDLDEAGRRLAFERALALRELEAALDPEGLSTTARAVLRKVRGAAGP